MQVMYTQFLFQVGKDAPVAISAARKLGVVELDRLITLLEAARDILRDDTTGLPAAEEVNDGR